MSELLQEIMEDEAQHLYCCYCGQPKSGYSCCQENHFIEFQYFDSETQLEIAKGIANV
jgi:hypothetical protein